MKDEYTEKYMNIVSEEANGQGIGQGNDRQGTGGTDKCYCPECGEVTKHEKGVPCNEMNCPECGTSMTGVEQ